MIRIRTKIDKDKVSTLFHNNEWITLYSINGIKLSDSADNFLDAGINHLKYCKLIKDKNIS